MRFRDRKDAGRRLVDKLAAKYSRQQGVVYALPRGGVVLGAEIARGLGMPLDLIIARKLGHPSNPEYAIGAVGETGELVTNRQETDYIPKAWLQECIEAEQHEARRRQTTYLQGRAPLPAQGKTAILTDDGIATGLTMEVAIRELRHRHPARIVVAVPVIPANTAAKLAREVDEVVALDVPDSYLGAVGAYYEYFPQISDDEVIALMRESGATSPEVNVKTESVSILSEANVHEGVLEVPPVAQGIVLFAHGSGSSRFSRRNRFVAERLQRVGMATLLFDLLTEAEDAEYSNRFDIALLTRRLLAATDWVGGEAALRDLALGYFGASTGAAAALGAAAERPDVRAVVSRGGRPDLAMDVLERVRAPTLLIVGGNDDAVIELNRGAYERLRAPKALEIVPGATHLFEEPGKLEEVARLAGGWFQQYLAGAPTS